MKLVELSQSLSTINFSTLSFQSSKNIKVKVQSEYRNKRTQFKGSIPRIYPKPFHKFSKTRKIARRASVMKYTFDKIADMQYLYQYQTIPVMICDVI